MLTPHHSRAHWQPDRDRITRVAGLPAPASPEPAGLSATFTTSFYELLAAGDRASALQVLDEEIQRTYELHDAVDEFERRLHADRCEATQRSGGRTP